MGDTNRKNGNIDRPLIQIMLFGLSGSGKTNLLASLLRQMYDNSIKKKDMYYSLELMDDSELFREAGKVTDWFKQYGKGTFPNSTSSDENFPFILRITKDNESYNWPIELRDYVGGDINVLGKDKDDPAAVEKFEKEQEKLEDAEIVFVLIDAIALAINCAKYDSNVSMCVENMNAYSVNATLSNIIKTKGSRGGNVTIMFLLTKTDASIFEQEQYREYKANNFLKLREMTKKIYQKIFAEVKHQVKVNCWDLGIIPVCICGEGNVITTVSEKNNVENEMIEAGRIDPKGVDIAFMYSVRCTLRSRISVMESAMNRYQEDIDQGRIFLELDENDNVVSECTSMFKAFLRDKEKALDFKARIRSAKKGIENKKMLRTQIYELEKMKDLIDEGYGEDFNKFVFDRFGPEAEVKRVDRTVK